MYSVVYTVHCTLYSVKCTVYSVEFSSVQCTVWCTVCILQRERREERERENGVHSAPEYAQRCRVRCAVLSDALHSLSRERREEREDILRCAALTFEREKRGERREEIFSDALHSLFPTVDSDFPCL
jgi:hypothetical protein